MWVGSSHAGKVNLTLNKWYNNKYGEWTIEGRTGHDGLSNEEESISARRMTKEAMEGSLFPGTWEIVVF